MKLRSSAYLFIACLSYGCSPDAQEIEGEVEKADKEVRELIAGLQSSDPNRRAASADDLGGHGVTAHAAIADLILLLSDSNPVEGYSDWHGTVATSAENALTEIGPASVDFLVAALDDDDPVVRNNAVVVLGRIKDERGVGAIVAMLRDKERAMDLSIRENLISALGQIGGDQALAALVATLNEGDDGLTGVSLKAIGDTGKPDGATHVYPYLNSEHEHVRWAAIYAIGQLGGKLGESEVIAALGEESMGIRMAAVQSLGAMKAVGAVPSLESLMDDESVSKVDLGFSFRLAIIDALVEIGGSESIRILENISSSDGPVMLQSYAAQKLKNMK